MAILDFFKRREEKDYGSGTVGAAVVNQYDMSKTKGTISKGERMAAYRGWVYGIITMVSNNVGEGDLGLFALTQEGQGEIKNYKTKALNLKQKIDVKSLITSDGTNVEALPQHPAIELIRKANQFTNGFDLMYLTQTNLDLYGDCYWYVPKDSEGTPNAIYILPTLKVSIMANKEGTRVIYYGLSDNKGKITKFTPEEIVHFKHSTPASNFYGESPLASLAMPITKISLSNQLEHAVLKNNGAPQLLLKSNKELTGPELRAMEIQWSKATKNGKQGGVKVIPNYMEIEPLNLSLKDLMLTDSQSWDLKNIALGYGVPYSLIDSSDQKKAGLDQALKQMAINCVIPRMTRIEQTLNQSYLPMWGEDDIKFKYSDPTPENEKEKSEILVDYVGAGIISKEEARSLIGL